MIQMAAIVKRIKSLPARTAKEAPLYLKRNAKNDMVAGLTVTVMGVPQAMAYALIAGLPPAFGLYTAIITCVVAALMGSSNHLVTGPTNALCMVILSMTNHLPAKYGLSIIEIVFLLTLMTGLIQLGFGLLNLGGILRYVSNSVVVGFTSGAGILIAGNQLKNVMGISVPKEEADHFFHLLWLTAQKIPETNLYSLALGVGTALMVVALPKINRRIPGALIGVLASSAVVYFFGWYEDGPNKVKIVRDIDPIARTLNIFHVPDLVRHPNRELIRELGSGALALAILGLIEAASIARAVAASSGQRLNFTREFVGQGLGNIGGSFFSCFAGSGSFTRTAVNYQSGARTRMAAVFSAVWTALTILLLAEAANFIPTASLAGMLIVIAYSMIEKHRLRLAWKTGSNSRLVLGGTMFATLVLPLEYAIFVGVFLSIVLLLKVTGKTDLTQLVPRSDSGFDELPFNRAPASPIVTINMEGDLYFAAVEDLDYELHRALTDVTRVVVLRMKRLRAVGSTAMAILEHFDQMLQKRDIQLVVCGIEEDLIDVMTHTGLRERLGEQNIFYADNKLFQSTELAMARAMSIVEMARRREQAASKTSAVVMATGMTARELMTRNCIRFGNQHQLREAAWLLSEMNRRRRSVDPQPLFLQNKEGKLAGVLSTWKILQEMMAGLDMKKADGMSDKELGQYFATHMIHPITEMARTDLPRVNAGDSFCTLLALSVSQDLRVLPVCDDGERVIGLVGQTDLLAGLGKVLDSAPGEEANLSD